MSELKPCPCCDEVKHICNYTISLELGIVMFGCAKCAFFAKNKTVWQNRQYENKIKAEAVLEAAYKNRKSMVDGGTKWLCSVDDLVEHANKLERGEV